MEEHEKQTDKEKRNR